MKTNTDRPNIILIITDQQRYETIKALGYDYMETPNLDRLVNEGVVLEQCHITAPSCAPSRASLFTGTYPHTNNVLKNKDPWTRTWISDLAKSGYYCVNIGKMHTEPLEDKFGFHERYVVENKDRYLEDRYFSDEWDKALKAHGLVKQGRPLYRQYPEYRDSMGAFEWKLPEPLQSDMFTGDTAEWWIRNKPKPDAPLFMEIGFPGPHPPFDPTAKYLEKYKGKKLPLPKIKREDIAGQPQGFRDLREHNFEVDHDSVVHLDDPTEEQLQRLWEHYLANVTMIDEKVGNILSALEDEGYLENSVIFFTSDHGEALGEHGHIQKWTMYDCITRVPTIAWSPKRFGKGRSLDGLCQLMDLGPTILDLAGVEKPEWMEAESLLPALEGEAFEGRPYVIAEHGKDMFLNTIDFVTMIRTREWKLVHFLDMPDGQLFDLVNDPAEEINLWDKPECQGKKTELLDELREFRIRSGYKARGFWSEVAT
ncbi:MAG: sulfatase [Puniceicoccaceae bacterium]